MAVRVVSTPTGGQSPRGPSGLFPTTNNTSGYRPPTSPRTNNNNNGALSATSTLASTGGGGDLTGYRPTNGGGSGQSPRGGVGGAPALAASSCGPRSGPSMIMTKVDLVSDRNAAHTIAGLKIAAAAAAGGGLQHGGGGAGGGAAFQQSYNAMGGSASGATAAGFAASSYGGAGSPALGGTLLGANGLASGNNTNNSHNNNAPPPPAVNIQNGIHIIIPAPPPSWSGGGAPSSVIQRAFLASSGGPSASPSTGGNNSANSSSLTHSMVSVTESPYYTHQSLKDSQRRSEARLSEATMRQIKRNAGAAGPLTAMSTAANNTNPNTNEATNDDDPNNGTVGNSPSRQPQTSEPYRPKGTVQSTIPTTGGRLTTASAPKSVVIVPLNPSDMAAAIAGSSKASGGENNHQQQAAAGSSPAAGRGAAPPVGTTTIRPIPPERRLGAPTVSSQGGEASIANHRNVCGVAIVEVTDSGLMGGGDGSGRMSPNENGNGGGGNPLVEQRAGLVLPTRAEERYRSEVLVAEAVRQAEAAAHIYNDPSFKLGTPDRRRGGQGGRVGGVQQQQPPAVSSPPSSPMAAAVGPLPASTIGIGEDCGRSRVLSSSVRFGHHSEALQRMAHESQQRVGFAVEMAPTLGAAPPTPEQPPHAATARGLIPAPPPNPLLLTSSSAAHTARHLGSAGGAGGTPRKRTGYGEAQTAPSSPVAFGIASPRFGPTSICPSEPLESASPDGRRKKKNARAGERAPPVGHYNPKYSHTETVATRNIFFAGHGVPYEKPKPSKGADDASLSATAKEQQNAAIPNRTGVESNSVSFRHMSPAERRAEEARRKQEAAQKARQHLTARERAKIRIAEEEEAAAANGGDQQKSSAFMSSLPRLQTSPRRDAEVVHASAIGNTPYGAFNEAVLSTTPRTKNVSLSASLGARSGRDRAGLLGWDRRPEEGAPALIRETNYTGAIFGDSRDSSAFPRGYVDMSRQGGRALPAHSHSAQQLATGGAQLRAGQSAPLNSLDLKERPEGDIGATSKYRNTLGTSTPRGEGGSNSPPPMARHSPRKFVVKPANNVTSDERPDVLGVAFTGSQATKGPKSPIAFSKQTSHPDVAFRSPCAVDTYDTEYINPADGTIASTLQAKNEALTPRTRQACFERMGSHGDYNSFAKAAERARQHTADIGISDAAVQSAFTHTRPKTLKNVDFTLLAPRKDDTRPLVDSCADPEKVYPKHILHDRVGGDPRMASHTSREAAKRATALRPARTTDAFYDVPQHVGYTGDRCKAPPNAVDIAKNSGRNAYGAQRNVNAPHLTAAGGGQNGAASGGGSNSSPLRGGRQGEATADLGPGQYDYNVAVLSKPLPAVSFGKQIVL